MNKNIKEMLKSVDESPDPLRKDTFIRDYRKRYATGRRSTWDLLKSQIGYIRPVVWIISVLALLLAAIRVHSAGDTLFIVAAMMPFVSGSAIIESFRARHYGMAELDGTTLFSTKGILFTRIICVGTVHIALLAVLTVLIGRIDEHGILMTGAILTIPYLLSSVICMELERTAFGRKNSFSCIGVAALITGMVLMSRDQEHIFNASYQWIWVTAMIALMAMEFIEIRKTFYWEEYAWN